jgi:hypothetical protein
MSTKRDPQKLLEEIEAFLTRTGMNATEFGLRAKGDGFVVGRLRQGKDVRSGTASELRRFMETYRRPLPETCDRRPRSAAHA